MNPLTNVKNINKLNETELARGVTNKSSWHNIYKDSAWIFIGGLAYGITEGDIIIVFSQYGEIVNINMVRDKKTGKTKGFCFLCYANQKSTVLAVDNLNGIKLCQRIIRVDHVADYKPPKEHENDDIITRSLHTEGCAPEVFKVSSEDEVQVIEIPPKKIKKEKKKNKKKHKKHSRSDSSSESDEIERQSSKITKTPDSSRVEHRTLNKLTRTSANNFSTNLKSSKMVKKHSEKLPDTDSTTRRHYSKHKSTKKRHHSDSDNYQSSSDVDLKKRKENSKRESHNEYHQKKNDREQHSRDYRSHVSSKNCQDRTREKEYNC